MSGRQGKRPRQNQREPSTATSTADGGGSAFLLKLSEACKSHEEKAHRKSRSGSNKVPPDVCKNELQALKRLLPKVEAKVASGKPPATDVKHLCDFYNGVLTGVFCPHAPQLIFESGVGATELLPRIHFLFQHLVSRSVISNTVAARNASGEAAPEPVSAYISFTLGRLLSYVPEDSLQQAALRDLIYLGMDLAVLAESGLLEHASKEVEVVIFPEMLELSGLPNGTEYTISVSSWESLLSLQSATFATLETFVSLQKKKRMSSDAVVETESQSGPVGVDLHFLEVLDDSEVMSTLVGSLKQVLLTKTPTDRKLRALSIRAKESAAKVLVALQEDLTRDGACSMAMLVELSLLVAQATTIHLQTAWDFDRASADCGTCYSTILSSLVDHLILFPPRVHGSAPGIDVAKCVAQAAFTALLECLRYIKAEPFQVDDSGTILVDERKLEPLVLRTIHACINRFHGSGGSPDSPLLAAVSQEDVENLVRLLRDPLLSDGAVWILSCVLHPEQAPMDRLSDIDRVCSSSLEGIQDVPKSDDGDDATNESPPSGSKRKRSSTAGSFPSSTLTIETSSPSKRRKSDGAKDRRSSAEDYGQQNRCVTFCFAVKKLRKFLSRVLDSVKKLQTSLSTETLALQSDGAIATSSVPVWTNAVSQATDVSSALRVLLTILMKVKCLDPDTAESFSGLFNLFSRLLGSMEELSQLFENVPDNTIASASLLRILIETAVKCGIHCHYCLATQDPPPILVKALSDRNGTMVTFSKNFRTLEMTECGTNGLPSLPKALTESAFHCVLSSLVHGDLPNVVSILDQGMTAVQSGIKRGCPSSVVYTSSILGAVSKESDQQSLHLYLLSRRLVQPSPAGNLSLQEATQNLVNSLGQMDNDPTTRLIKWKSLSWLFYETAPGELRLFLGSDGAGADSGAGGSTVKFLVDTAFADPDNVVREYASSEIGNVLSVSDCSGVLALLAQDEEWQCLRDRSAANRPRRDVVANQLTARLYQEVDGLLHEYCHVPQSQLSFTVRTPPVSRQHDTAKSEQSIDSLLSFQRSAVRALVSICQAANIETPCGKIMFELSLCRLVRLWTSLESGRRLEGAGLALGEISRLSRVVDINERLREKCMTSLMPRLFQDILIPSSGFLVRAAQAGIDSIPPEIRERQYRLLTAFLRRFLCTSKDSSGEACGPVMEATVADVERAFEICAPSVLAQLVLEKDYDALRLVTGFKLFLLSWTKAIRKLEQRDSSSIRSGPPSDLVIGDTNSAEPKTSAWTRHLEDQTRNLCLSSFIIENILPPIFMRAGRSEFIFFLKDVLQGKMTLKQMLARRGPLILKSFVLELGHGTDASGAIHAIKTAALARNQDSMTPNSVEEAKGPGQARDLSAASDWITSNFMYLLVNVGQYKWRSRNTLERLRAVRCIFFILDFLHPSESAQYVPQIMATVNASIAQYEDGSESSQDRYYRRELRLLAVHVLSKFVKIVAQHQWQAVGQNLTTIVVSLIPILSDEEFDDSDPVEKSFKGEAIKSAVGLLDCLTKGDLGKNLAVFFKEIPFIPSTPALDSVRNSLRALGVDFDNLHVITTQGTQQESLYRESAPSDGGSTATDSRGFSSNTRRQNALKKRLEMVCSLLGNESTSIRRVVLDHLTSLLRANRELFHSLVDNEGATSMQRYMTIMHQGSGFSRGTVTEMVEALLSRSVHETDLETRVLLATCIGEIGAIGEHRLEETTGASANDRDDEYAWRLENPPWRFRPTRYQLKLVTQHLVVALKAAPTSVDQMKIAFSIQQLLVLLDKCAGESDAAQGSKSSRVSSRTPVAETEAMSTETGRRPKMNDWLSTKLSEADVLDVVEPFWFSEFRETDSTSTNQPQPPFFRECSTYFSWMSNWCRFMVLRTNDSNTSQWSGFFYACRTAIRTQAGLSVAEFLLPILVLDRICFGNTSDEQAVVNETRDVLTFDGDGSAKLMNQTERQKAVSAVFMVIDTLQSWSEQETELKHKNSSGSMSDSLSDRRSYAASSAGDDWPMDDSIMRIDDILQAIPLSMRAHAAARVGMHARALRLLEMAMRAQTVDRVFNGNAGVKGDEGPTKWNRSRAVGTCASSDMGLMKEVLAALNDYETMASLQDETLLTDPRIRARDSIRQKEACGDWEGALQEYERVQQLDFSGRHDPSTQRGALLCMLRLGHLESVLNQVHGLVHSDVKDIVLDMSSAIPIATEASWRLGRWDSLEQFLDTKGNANANSEGAYQLSLGHAMLGLHNKDQHTVSLKVEAARSATMEELSSVARDSYARAYDHIVKLHSLREIEDTVELLCGDDSTTTLGDWTRDSGCDWQRRLDLVSATGATTIMNTRLALARLRGDSAIEVSLFLNMGKRARKSGLYSIATNAFAQAEAAFNCIDPDRRAGSEGFLSSLHMQVAKLKHEIGESSTALRMLGQENLENMAELDESSLRLAALRHTNLTMATTLGTNEQNLIDDFVKSALQSTRWMIEGGLKGGAEIMGRFRIITTLAPKWEKGYFQFAKYIDSVMQSRIMALQRRSSDNYLGADEDLIRSRTIAQDRACQKYVLLAIQNYAQALSLDLKHVYQALPRLLSFWFEFTSIGKKDARADLKLPVSSQIQSPEMAVVLLSQNQEEANAFMAKQFKQIPAQAFYTAMPQLISRVIHDDKETALVVRGILKRVLTKFPAQAMWPLSWLRQSKDNERTKIGEAIFHEAERGLMKGSNQSIYKLLVASKSLVRYFQDLAKYPLKDASVPAINVKPWKGEVELCEFVPPIQAALAATLSCTDSTRSRDLFPRQVPRMRTFLQRVTVMGSKARPKKLKALVIPADSSFRSTSTRRTDDDIGEIHFLLKQEAKGDLRKDARVQDLNNVINRLMESTSEGKGGSRSSRRLRLRTFAVTCLSEDTGILEWVPNTESLRSLVSKAYNPQASPFSSKRRGRRLANFGDPLLRNNFEKKVQDMYFKNGNLKRATQLFEELCLKPYPPLLHWWFVQQFHDPHAWYEARTRFTLSAAAWSAVGHVIGLGDRHSDNILVDTSTGECVHVDFDCIFDKGLNLPKPEVIPFRLTQNMLDAFGPTGADGIFTGSLKAAMGTLRLNRDTLLCVLEPFLKDPVIDWKRYRSQQKSKKGGSTQERQNKEAKRSINVIDERLKGIYNLRNPNYKKIRRTDGLSSDQQEDDLSDLLPLSVEGQVHKLIAESTNNENLVQLYVGWMPWV